MDITKRIVKHLLILCTDNFTHSECLRLVEVLKTFNILSTVNKHTVDTYRIRISKRSMLLLRELVTPHMHPYFIYKLGQI